MKTHAATIILGILMIIWVSLNSWASDQDRNTSLDQQQNPEIRRELTSNGETMEEVKKNKRSDNINQERREDLLEELLQDSTTTGAAIPHRNSPPPSPKEPGGK